MFLPIAVILFYLTPNRFKPITLTAISIYFYYLVSPSYLLIILMSVLFDYFIATQIQFHMPKSFIRKSIFALAVAKNLGIYLYYGIMSQIEGENAPFGIMLVSLTGLGYIIDVYKKEIIPEYNVMRYISYAMFFPRLYVGPLVPYGDMKGQLIHIKPSLTGISRGIVMFIFGLAKKIIMADTMIKLYSSLLSIPQYEYSVLTAWILMISFAFSLYFTLSGYFDVARGLALIFSLKLPFGFYYPFQARSLDEFFARFNITVNEFVRKYVYVGLGEKNNGTLSASLNILLVSMLISMWYGIKINCLVWGIYLAIFIILEQFVYGKYWRKMPIFIQRALTFCITMMSFSILLGNNITETTFYLKTMFGFNNTPLTDITTAYYLYSNSVLFVLAFVMCTSFGNNLSKYMSQKFPSIWDTLGVAYNISLLVCVSAILIQ